MWTENALFPSFWRVVVSLVARIFVPEPNTEFFLCDTEAAVNGKIIALPEAVGLNI